MASAGTGLICTDCGALEGSDFPVVTGFADEAKLCPTCRATRVADRRMETDFLREAAVSQLEGRMVAGVKSSVVEGKEERRILVQINDLSSRLQEQRRRPRADPQTQRAAIRGLEQGLSACWE